MTAIERGQTWLPEEGEDGPVYVLGVSSSADERFTIVHYEYIEDDDHDLTDGFHSCEESLFRSQWPRQRKEPRNPYLVVEGNPMDGINHHGMFADAEEAHRWADHHCGGEWWVIDIHTVDRDG